MPALIFTFVYAAPEDDAFIKGTIEVIERHGGDVKFVRLYCDLDVNETRVTAADRRALGKIATVDSLRRMRERWRLDGMIPYRPSLKIDNSTLPPEVSARRIAEQLALPMRAAQ
jgi:hypothetical protein